MPPEPKGESTVYGPSRVLSTIDISPVFGGNSKRAMKRARLYLHLIQETRLLRICGEAASGTQSCNKIRILIPRSACAYATEWPARKHTRGEEQWLQLPVDHLSASRLASLH